MLTMEKTRLIERCRQGDADALGELYKTYAQQMRGVCRRYINNEQTVEDVLHDAFVIIFTSFDRLRDNNKAEAWMTAITRNVASKCKDHLEALPTVSLDETSEADLIATEEIGDCKSPQTDCKSPQTDSKSHQTVRGVPLSEVARMIDRLPEGYGQVFRLSVFEGMSHKEIAGMLGIEPHSSSSQLARAKKMLRKMMRQYWVAVLLLLLVPFSFVLLRNGDTAAKDEKPVVAKTGIANPLKQKPAKESPTERPLEPVIISLPVHRTTVVATKALQSGIANPLKQIANPLKQIANPLKQTADSITADTLSNMAAREQTNSNATGPDTARIIREGEPQRYDMAGLFPNKPATGTNDGKKWSLDLAYAGQTDEQRRYNQPFSYKPAPTDAQSLPGPSPGPIVPGSIDNWTDYAVYLANHPDVVSDATRSAIMRIALNNANRPGEDKILRTSHHRMPVTWSLALKYRLNNRFGLESGLSYSRLASDFEMGTDGNSIHEQQRIHYLGIPMKGIYNMYGGKLWGLYGSLGMTTEIPVHSTLRSDFFVNGQYEASEKTSFRAPWHFSTTMGIGLQYHLTPSIGFFVEPSLQYYIPMKTDVETYRTEHPFTFSVPLGIRFTW
ncbi:MAG: sigma-70 family RNA polymerase sigma factor [Prevotella sp.]|nr:sigma-70 family RNA polymerase sigma factor [Prevotella sp.]